MAAKPGRVLAGTLPLPQRNDLLAEGWVWEPMATGGLLRLRHDKASRIRIER